MVPDISKKTESVAAYILDIFKVEDCIKELNFELASISKYLNAKSEDDRAWLEKAVDELKEKPHEHLREVQLICEQLVTLNLELLKSDIEYRRIFDKAKLQIIRFQKENDLKDAVIACLKGVYEFNHTKNAHQQISLNLKESAFAFNNVLSYLSYKFKQRHSSMSY